MAFYIKPPEGGVSLSSLEKFGRKRLAFLYEVMKCDGSEGFQKLVSESDTAVDSECLIEGSKRDRTSHFLLRLVCCEDKEMFNFLLQAETELFGYRFSNMNTQELFQFLKSTHKFVTRCLKFKTCASDDTVCNLQMALDMIYSATGSWHAVVQKYMNDCNTETFQIPFQLALSLVAGRQVDLKDGLASVPFSKLHVVLSSLFHTLLKEGLHKAAVVWNKAGDREIELVQGLKLFCQKLLGYPHPRRSALDHYLLSDEVDEEAAYFPPCMIHLHRVLRQRHRLRHHSRVQYTLYLKGIGLPPDEALDFWKREYIQPEIDRFGNSVTCRHSWQKEHKRYTYNIRHLYGLEGARTNYSAHSCRFLQMYTPGPEEEGGCPFSQSDDRFLQTFMDIEEIDQLSRGDILLHSKNRQYTEACRKFFVSKVNQEIRKTLEPSRSREEWCSDDTVIKGEKCDGSNVTLQQYHTTNVEGDNSVRRGYSEYCNKCETSAGSLDETAVRFEGIHSQCLKEKVSGTVESNSRTWSKTRMKSRCDILQCSHSVQSERTSDKGKGAISKSEQDDYKRRKASHNSNNERTPNLDAKDSGYDSALDIIVSVPKARIITVNQSNVKIDRKFVKGKRPFSTSMTDGAVHDAYVNRSGNAFENQRIDFVNGDHTELYKQINEMTSGGKSDLQDNEMIITLGNNFRKVDANLCTPSKRIVSGIVVGNQDFRADSLSNARGDVGGRTDVSRNSDYGNVIPVAIEDGAIKQLYQNIRTQDIHKPSDFYTSFRKLISDLKNLN